jgi:transcriptional regulator
MKLIHRRILILRKKGKTNIQIAEILNLSKNQISYQSALLSQYQQKTEAFEELLERLFDLDNKVL